MGLLLVKRHTRTAICAAAVIAAATACTPGTTGAGPSGPPPSSATTPSSPSTPPLVTPSVPAPPSTGPSGTSGASGAVTVAARKICTVKAPAAITAALAGGPRPEGHGGYFRPRGLSGGELVGGAGKDDSSLVAVDPRSGKERRIADVPDGSVATWMHGDGTHVAWLLQPTDGYAPGWALYAAAAGGQPVHIAGDLDAKDGTVSTPVLTGGRIVWLASPKRDRGTATVHVADLTTGKVTTGATGTFSAVAAMGDVLVVSARTAGTASILFAFDARTLGRRPLPSGLPTRAGVGHMVGTPDRLAWSSADSKSLSVWKRASNTVDTYTLDPMDEHAFQFMQMSGPYMSWFASQTNSVMDLDSGTMYDVGLNTSTVVDNGMVGAAAGGPAGADEPAAPGPARLVLKPGGDWFADTRCGTTT